MHAFRAAASQRVVLGAGRRRLVVPGDSGAVRVLPVDSASAVPPWPWWHGGIPLLGRSDCQDLVQLYGVAFEGQPGCGHVQPPHPRSADSDLADTGAPVRAGSERSAHAQGVRMACDRRGVGRTGTARPAAVVGGQPKWQRTPTPRTGPTAAFSGGPLTPVFSSNQAANGRSRITIDPPCPCR